MKRFTHTYVQYIINHIFLIEIKKKAYLAGFVGNLRMQFRLIESLAWYYQQGFVFKEQNGK